MQSVTLKQLAKHIGWISLSILCNTIILFLVQWLTFEVANLLLIENHLLLFLLSCLLAVIFPKRYALTGTFVFVALLLFLMFLEHNLTFTLYNACALLFLGAATGTFVKQKKWWFSAGSFVLSLLVLWNAHRHYSTIEVVRVAPQQKTDVASFNEQSKTFISHNGDSLHLSLDTIYLVNFTFYACKPCREKHPSLKLLEKTFANQAFKLVTIHCVDSPEIFQKHYQNIDNCYHNPNQKNSLKLGVSSYPYEIIFSKNGQEIRRHSGFTLEAKEDYLTQTKSLIEKLLLEKTS
jgi:thiol-disulfide isomerase/thioredoxin